MLLSRGLFNQCTEAPMDSAWPMGENMPAFELICFWKATFLEGNVPIPNYEKYFWRHSLVFRNHTLWLLYGWPTLWRMPCFYKNPTPYKMEECPKLRAMLSHETMAIWTAPWIDRCGPNFRYSSYGISAILWYNASLGIRRNGRYNPLSRCQN